MMTRIKLVTSSFMIFDRRVEYFNFSIRKLGTVQKSLRGTRDQKINSKLTSRIKSYTSFWFGPENLPKDEFLLTTMEKNEGWVSLESLCNFPKLKKLGVKPVNLYNALKDSQKFTVTETALKLRVLNRNFSSETLMDYINSLENKLKASKIKASIHKDIKLEVYQSKKRIVVCYNEMAMNNAISAMKEEISKVAIENGRFHSVVGFDVEYASIDQGGPKLPALLSFCTPTTAYLFHLDKLPSHGLNLNEVPKMLINFLSNENVLKVGVGLENDVNALLRNWAEREKLLGRKLVDSYWENYRIAGILSITDILCHLNPLWEHEGRTDVSTDCYPGSSLKDLTALFLGKRLIKRKYESTKKKHTVRSHWRVKTLSPTQQQYAANDVSASLEIFLEVLKYDTDSSMFAAESQVYLLYTMAGDDME